MELILIKSYKHLSTYEKEWKAILIESKNTSPFMEYEYVYNWWKSLVEEINIEIHAVKENNRVIAFFPFQLNKTWFGYRIQFLSFKGTNLIGISAKPSDMDRVIMFTFDALIQQKNSAIFQLVGLDEGGKTSAKLSNYLKARSIREQSFQIVNINTTLLSPNENYTRTTIFSTNTLTAKLYRNFLWTKEKINSKGIGRIRK